MLEKTLTALSDIVQLKSLLAACTTADRKDANTSTVTWAADWTSLMSYATFLQEAVQNTTAALDTTSQLGTCLPLQRIMFIRSLSLFCHVFVLYT